MKRIITSTIDRLIVSLLASSQKMKNLGIKGTVALVGSLKAYNVGIEIEVELELG